MRIAFLTIKEPEEEQVKAVEPKNESPENYDDGPDEPIKFSAISRKKTESQEIISEELDPESKQFAQQELLYRGYDPEPHKLVQRPVKDVVWGLGGELLKRKTRRIFFLELIFRIF